MGDVIDIFPLAGKITNADTGEMLAEYAYKAAVLLDACLYYTYDSAD